MPAYVTIPKAEAFGYQGAVYLGAAYNPFEVGADPNAADFRFPTWPCRRELALRQRAEPRPTALKEFDTLRRDIDETGALEGLDSFKAQALEMVTGDRVREAFDIEQGRPAGCATATAGTSTARAPCSPGGWSRRARCVTINTGYWDHHNDIEKGSSSTCRRSTRRSPRWSKTSTPAGCSTT